MRIIFLDIDGVLNSEDYLSKPETRKNIEEARDTLHFVSAQVDQQAVGVLNELCSDTGAQIVISSTWRTLFPTETLDDVLHGRGLDPRARIIGKTPRLGGARGDEIVQWLGTAAEHARIGGEPVESFVILDDDADMGELGDRLVQTDPKHGLTRQHTKRARELLTMG